MTLRRVIIGIDPGSVRLGVAFVDATTAEVLRTVAVEATFKVNEPYSVVGKTIRARKRNPTALERMRKIEHDLDEIFEWAVSRKYDGLEPWIVVGVVVEEAIFPGMGTTSIARLAEVRGTVFATAWRKGWTVSTVNQASWKRYLSVGERVMKKDAAYVAWMNKTRRMQCRIPDEVDAALIAQSQVQGGGASSRSGAAPRRRARSRNWRTSKAG